MSETIEKKVIKDSSYSTLAFGIMIVSGAVRGILVPKFIDPASFGLLSALMLIITYSEYSHLGVLYGMSRQVPYYQGKGEYQKESESKNNSFSFALIISLVIFFVIIAISFIKQDTYSTSAIIGLRVFSILVILQVMFIFYTRLMSAEKKFISLSKATVLRAIVWTVSMVILTYIYKFYGALVSLLITSITVILFLMKTSGYTPKFDFNKKVIWELMVVGLPLSIISLATIIIKSIDRALIISLLGKVQMGYYSLGVMSADTVFLASSSALGTLSPHIAFHTSKAEEDPTIMHKFFIRPTIVVSYFSSFLIGCAIFSFTLLIPLFLPNYINGLIPLYIITIGTFFLCTTLSAGNIIANVLISKGKQTILIGIQAGIILISTIVNYSLIKSGFGIKGVALGSTITYFIYSISILVLTSKYILLDSKNLIKLIIKSYLPFISVLAIVIFVYTLQLNFYLKSIIGFLMVAIAFILLSFKLNCDTMFITEVYSILKDRFKL